MNKQISIIVPIYNVEKYLRRCIDAILNQTISNLEIILVDDGSPDLCPQICDEYAKRDNRIVVIHQENGGLSAARNAGIKAAKGEYIGFVDSDDYISPNMYELLYDNIEHYDADIAICNFEYVDDNGNALNRPSPMKTEVLTNKQALRKLEEKRWTYYVTAWNKLYRRSLFDEVTFPIGKLNEDSAIMHELFHKSRQIATIDDKLYYYVQRNNSIISGGYNVKRLDEVEAIYKRYRYYKEQGLDEFIPKTPDVIKEVYCNLRGKIVAKSKDERARVKEIDDMFREVYFSNKNNITIINKLKFLMPDVTFPIRQVFIDMNIKKYE